MRTLVLMLIVAGALVVAIPAEAKADVVFGPLNFPTCVQRPGPCQPVYTPRCPCRTHFCRPGPPVYTPRCPRICMPCVPRSCCRCMPRGLRLRGCSTGPYTRSRTYPGPIGDFGGQTTVSRRQKPYGRGSGLWYWGRCR